MTLEQTRQLGIEFERRVQTMIPDTEFVAKLDTDTIYSYLNQYQDKFVHDIYKSLDVFSQQPRVSAYVETILQALLQDAVLNITQVDDVYSANLPSDFGLYISSVTNVDKIYSIKNTTENKGLSGAVPNTLVSQTVAQSFIGQPHDNLRIMRNPIVYMGNNSTILLQNANIYESYDVICLRIANGGV